MYPYKNPSQFLKYEEEDTLITYGMAAIILSKSDNSKYQSAGLFALGTCFHHAYAHYARKIIKSTKILPFIHCNRSFKFYGI